MDPYVQISGFRYMNSHRKASAFKRFCYHITSEIKGATGVFPNVHLPETGIKGQNTTSLSICSLLSVSIIVCLPDAPPSLSLSLSLSVDTHCDSAIVC